MKKWLIGVAFITVISIIVVGKVKWDQKVEETALEVEMVLEQKQESKVDKSGSDETSDEVKVEVQPGADATVGSNRESKTASSDPETKTEPADPQQTSSETISGSDSVTNNDEDHSRNNEETDRSGGDNKKTSDENNHENSGDKKSTDDKVVEKLSLGQIKDKYFLEFRELERIQNEQLDQLFLEAYNEYEYNKANSITYSRDEFIERYQKRATALEEAADVSFFNTYENMKKDLRQNGFAEEEAEPYLSIYETSKERRRTNYFEMLK